MGWRRNESSENSKKNVEASERIWPVRDSCRKPGVKRQVSVLSKTKSKFQRNGERAAASRGEAEYSKELCLVAGVWDSSK